MMIDKNNGKEKMKNYKWQDQITKETFEKEFNCEFQKDAENDAEFSAWANGRIVQRIK